MKKVSLSSNRIRIIGLLLVFVAVLIFVSKDAFLYRDTVVKIIGVDDACVDEQEGTYGGVETYYEQQMKAIILNGKKKGDIITLENSYSSSGVDTERYRKGDQLFVNVDDDGEGGTISGRKRDFQLAVLICMVLFLLLGLNGRHGGIIIVSLFFNFAFFIYVLFWYENGTDLITLAFILMVAFSVVTLLCAAGFHKKTLAAFLATMVTTLLCCGIYELALHFNERLPYEMMDYVMNPADLPELFLTGVLMGSLGAVMDVSISIVAGVAEIKERTPGISLKALVQSIREMGADIMGTMINVLFFTYISSALPIVVVKIMNGYTLYHLVHFHLVFEIIRFLMGAIGIVLAIPVSGVFAIVFLYGGKWKNWRKNR